MSWHNNNSDTLTLPQQQLVYEEVSRRKEILRLQKRIKVLAINRWYKRHALLIWFSFDFGFLATIYWLCQYHPSLIFLLQW